MRIKERLSYSQFSTYLSGENAYIKRYFEGVRLENKYLSFGSMIAEGLEFREAPTRNKDILIARKLIPCPQYREKEINADFGSVPLTGKMDGFWDKEQFLIEEYKTGKGGKNAWTQSKVDKHFQLIFYVIMISKIYGIPPEKIRVRLYWLETYEDTDGELHLTGQKRTFEAIFTQDDIIGSYPIIKRVWEGIEALTNKYAS
jgi:hypothetical protein